MPAKLHTYTPFDTREETRKQEILPVLSFENVNPIRGRKRRRIVEKKRGGGGRRGIVNYFAAELIEIIDLS